jgi:hypothetical protein
MLDANLQGSNPKLQTIKYVNVLPSGKLGDYTQNNRVDFSPDPVTCSYFDGAQSYLNIQVRNTSTYQQGNSVAAPTAVPPMCFPAHCGANAMINRCVIRSKNDNQVIEDLEAYNLLNSLKNSYTNDSDVFKTLGRITGVAGRTPRGLNQTVDNIAVNYFVPNGEFDLPTSNNVTGGNVGVSAQFCVPIESGLMSAYANQHHVVPNLDVPLHIQFFLEKNNVALHTLYHKFYRERVIEGVNVVEVIAVSPFEDVACEKTGTELLVDVDICDTELVSENEVYGTDMCAWRVGQAITDGADTRIITAVEIGQGINNDQIKITTDVAFSAGDGAINIQNAPVNRSYVIDKIELKLLLTIPDPSTMRMIRSQMSRGISFMSVQLYKQSTSQALKNAVIDIPEALTRASCLLAVPCDQNNLESLDLDNSYLFCTPDANNNTTYQWQIQNMLIPNLAVDTTLATNAKSDNAIFFNQVVMALRHMVNVKALADAPRVEKEEDLDIELPFFYPVSLSPVGQSFNLINSAPQLRINNVGNGTDITPKLYHIFVPHTRVLKSADDGVAISF